MGTSATCRHHCGLQGGRARAKPERETQREAVSELGRAVAERRQEISKLENLGLAKLCNLTDEGAYADLKKLHKQLDETVAAGYGWPKSVV